MTLIISTPPQLPPHPPPQIAKYHIVRRLGHGGMGAVYLGLDPDLDRSVAIKVLREPMADEELLQRFLREARATANLRHENLITIYEVGSHDQQPFIAMEYVDGTTIGELIKRRQPLPLVQKLAYIEQICAGLHHAHRVGIVHRDIKPANVMVDGNDVVRILDFGIARVANSGMTSDGTLIGTLNYMSPEQMLGRPVDFRSDIFSLGAMAYELLSYHQAFPGSLDDGLLHRLPNEAPAPLATVCPGLPQGLEEIVLRALAKNPLERFADLDEMRNAVRHLRRNVDPRLEVETVVIPSREKPKPPASSAERRGLLERRARQIALHRDAARAALLRGDLDGAAAACDDALTLDPDDAEATRLLAEIQKARAQHDEESKVRRERERTMRQRVADAEVTLSRGDVVTAARLLEEVFKAKTGDPAAFALLEKVREAATAAHVELPKTLNLAAARVRTDARVEAGTEPTRLARRPEPEQPRSRLPIYAAAGLAVLAVGGGVVWMMRGEQPAPSTNIAAAPSTSGAATSASPSTPAPLNPSPNPVAANPTTNSTANPTPTPPPRVTTAPAPGPAPASTTPAATPIDALAAPLAQIAQLQQSGDVAGALADLDRLGASNDNRVMSLARSVAQAAFRMMDAALAGATGQNAVKLAPASFTAAEQARSLADAASSRNDFVQAGTRALDAAERYRKAESEARSVAATLAAKGPDPASMKPSPPAVAAAPPSTTVPPRSSAPEIDPGILRALNIYRDAYARMSVDDVKKIHTDLGREAEQDLRNQFKACRSFDVTFGNMQTLLAPDDPTAATVNVQTTYTCQPRTGKDLLTNSQRDVFVLRKVGNNWLIESKGALDTQRRR